MVELWVSRVANNDPTAPWKPDMPDTGVTEWRCLGGIPTDKVNAPEKKSPLTAHLLVEVPDGQGKYVTGAVDVSLVPEEDQLTVRMIHECGDEYEKNAEAFFASIPSLGSAGDNTKRVAKRLVLQAAARGLSPAKAQAIITEYDLPEVSSVGR